ncbi:MAG: MBL fold metallo-hydrolase [Deltaproteobacteria bacterium]|nr:MBL fold metallo-hydrolase [Deltaproteobacteria bacterium]
MIAESLPALGATAADLALRSLGVARIAMSIPFAAAGGQVNVYLIDNADGSLTMFDTGLGNPAGWDALTAGFLAAGRRLQDVRRIIVSHGHMDHFGAARALHERTGAPVLVHPRDAAKVLDRPEDPQRRQAIGRYFLRLGAPLPAILQMGARYGKQERATARLDEVEALDPGLELEFGAFRATVVHTPGHTPGHVVLHADSARILLSADHLLGRISPCPLIEVGPRDEDKSFRALVAYFESLETIEAMELDWVLPGHGEPFTGHRKAIAGLRAFYEKRQARLLSLLQDGPRTPYEIAGAVFGKTRDDELYLTLSEIVGNLEVLEDSGRVERLREADVDRYRSTTP